MELSRILARNQSHYGFVDSVNNDMRHNLAALGWNKYFDDVANSLDDSLVVGRVSRLDRGWSTVLLSADYLVSGMIRVRNIGADVSVGDWVAVSKNLERVEHVLPRFSALVRRASSDAMRAERDVVAANINNVFIVHAATGQPNQRRVERELVLAFDSLAIPVLVLTKTDLATSAKHLEMLQDVGQICGVACHAVSGLTGDGFDELSKYCENYSTVGVLGASGVGKSTLVNRLVGSDAQDVGEVRKGDHRGRHTTNAADLIRLPNGGWLIDTPGLRALNLWTSGRGIERAFADIFSLAENCRFRDCKHHDEPDCRVQRAVVSGELHVERLTNMARLVAEELAIEQDQKTRQRLSNRKGMRKQD